MIHLTAAEFTHALDHAGLYVVSYRNDPHLLAKLSALNLLDARHEQSGVLMPEQLFLACEAMYEAIGRTCLRRAKAMRERTLLPGPGDAVRAWEAIEVAAGPVEEER